MWGLDDTAESVYRTALRGPDLDVAGLARRLGLAEEAVRAALEDLQRIGLVRLTPGGVQAAAPATVLGTLLHDELRALDDRRARLDAVRAGLAAFSADHLVGQTRDWSAVPFEVLSEEEAVAAFEELQRGTTGEVLTCRAVQETERAPASYSELVRAQLAAGRPMRAVYPASVVESPVKLDYVRRWAAAGEQVRLLPFSAREIDVFGDDAALVSSRWENRPGGMILIHAPAMVAICRDLFEHYWGRAVPFTAVGQPTDLNDRVLEMLMNGAKDEAIARHLGVSLRTVRRRIAALMDEFGATTRFQAGMEAARRGLL